MTRPLIRSILLSLAIPLSLSACTGEDPTRGLKRVAKLPEAKFTESEYGVSASPRLTTAATGLPKGGGHAKVGKPYKVRGVWYVPKDDPTYVKKGKASWYGPNFHGRKTANGEIFDQNHLSAAHTTFPLPSYARVTNLDNGRSVVVRVNDRGPYSHSRIIDLSKKTAEVLKFKQAGTANVKVEYVGRAPLHGDDHPKLMTSLRTIEPSATGYASLPSLDGVRAAFASVPKAAARAIAPKAPETAVSLTPPAGLRGSN